MSVERKYDYTAVFSGAVRGLFTECSWLDAKEINYQYLSPMPNPNKDGAEVPYVIKQNARIHLNDWMTSIYLHHPDSEDTPMITLVLKADKL